MRTDGMKAFWLAFWITLAVLAPLIGYTMLSIEWQQAPAASSKSDVAIVTPGEENQMTLLAAVAAEPQAFVLVRLDAPRNVLRLATVPAQSVVKNGAETVTLAECYTAAGPARVAALLADTLDVTIDRYLAATPETWQGLVEDLGPVRVGLSGALTTDQLARTGMSGEVREWTAPAARGYLQQLDTADPALIPPSAAASARAVLWQGWARQNLERLPGTLPAGLREVSGSLLTNLTATDLLTLEQTLEFLANAGAEPEGDVLPGTWNAAAARYEFSDDTLTWLAEFLGSGQAADAAPVPD